jgi:hypothetical protein
MYQVVKQKKIQVEKEERKNIKNKKRSSSTSYFLFLLILLHLEKISKSPISYQKSKRRLLPSLVPLPFELRLSRPTF